MSASSQTYPTTTAPPKRLPYWSCDWGQCDERTVGWRLDESDPPRWFAVCEEHLTEAPNGHWVRVRRG